MFIQNRKNQTICVLIETSQKQKGLVFIAHGLSGSKDEIHIKLFGESFKEKGFSVVWFDCTNTLGESDGNFENATTTNYYEDLEDVINWAKDQKWYQEPFWLCGHSLGGLNISKYAKENPNKVKGIIPASPTISANVIKRKSEHLVKKIDGVSWRFMPGLKPNEIVKLRWDNFINDLERYNLDDYLSKLKMPLLIMIGERENYYLPPLKEICEKYNINLKIIKNAQHVYTGDEQFKEIKGFIYEFIDKSQFLGNHPEEVIDRVDDNDNVIGQMTRAEKENSSYNFRISLILVSNSKGKLLLGKRPMHRVHSPGKWAVFGGHVNAGESYEAAAIRELEEELGFKGDVKLLGKFDRFNSKGSKVFDSIFHIEKDDGFIPDKREIEELKFFSKTDVDRLIKEKSELFAGPFIDGWKFLKKNNLI